MRNKLTAVMGSGAVVIKSTNRMSRPTWTLRPKPQRAGDEHSHASGGRSLAAVLSDVGLVRFQQRVFPFLRFSNRVLKHRQLDQIATLNGFHLTLGQGDDRIHREADVISETVLIWALRRQLRLHCMRQL